MTDEERQLREALDRADGSPTRAAVILGVSRMTVHRRMKKYGVEIKRVVDRAA
jgi:two-component system response regulator HydG